MSDKPRVLVHCGVIGSGKDHKSDIAVKEGYTRIDFKDELVDMMSDLVGYDIRPEYEWFKAAPLGWRKPGNPMSEGFEMSRAAEVLKSHPGTITGRIALQRLGTDVMRKRNSRYWVNAWMNKALKVIREGGNVVTADCRFINEVFAAGQVSADVKFVFCDYRSTRYNPHSEHESEALAQHLLKSGYRDGDEVKGWDSVKKAEATA